MKRFLYWLPALLWMGVIFFFSAQPKGALPDFNAFDFVIKKTAHFLEYAVLAILIFVGVNARVAWRWQQLVWALGLTVLYAVSDEGHQVFVAGREPHALDVLIDAFGATTALSLLWLWLRLRATPSQTLAE